MLPSLNLLLAYFRKTAFPFSNTGRVQSSGGSEQQQLSVNGSFVSVWRCLLEASYSPAPGSARSPVFSLNVNIRPHLAPGESHLPPLRSGFTFSFLISFMKLGLDQVTPNDQPRLYFSRPRGHKCKKFWYQTVIVDFLWSWRLVHREFALQCTNYHAPQAAAQQE